MDGARRETADQLLRKVRAFVAELEPQERALFAALIAPGVAQAHQDDDEVVGFDQTASPGVHWSAGRLPEALVAAIRDAGIRVEGLHQ